MCINNHVTVTTVIHLLKYMRQTLRILQLAVRMMAFGDIYKVLGMDPLPDSVTAANKSNKRKRVSSS